MSELPRSYCSEPNKDEGEKDDKVHKVRHGNNQCLGDKSYSWMSRGRLKNADQHIDSCDQKQCVNQMIRTYVTCHLAVHSHIVLLHCQPGVIAVVCFPAERGKLAQQLIDIGCRSKPCPHQQRKHDRVQNWKDEPHDIMVLMIPWVIQELHVCGMGIPLTSSHPDLRSPTFSDLSFLQPVAHSDSPVVAGQDNAEHQTNQ
mmetsp:Transcript_36654/g.66444  ORF Transcript_36654/g.66444 Transcript_36654/m.66444 type:complete len:200 (-) Transcript_36654:2370-2969(-)